MATSNLKTAIVTGACSGIGLAVTRYLLSITSASGNQPVWRVVLADVRRSAYKDIADTLDKTRTIFVRTDVADWDANVHLFKTAYEWDQAARIDFFHANAGTGDREFVDQKFDLDKEPQKPNLSCFDVNLHAIFYELKLMIHYARKTRRAAQVSNFDPKFVITSSMTGQYPWPTAPQYAASKAANLSLARSIGPWLLESDGIAVNAVLPGYVATRMIPGALNDVWPEDKRTPLTTITRAIKELISEEGIVEQDGKSDGINGVVKAGQTVECSLDKLYYREPVPFVDESARFVVEDARRNLGDTDQIVTSKNQEFKQIVKETCLRIPDGMLVTLKLTDTSHKLRLRGPRCDQLVHPRLNRKRSARPKADVGAIKRNLAILKISPTSGKLLTMVLQHSICDASQSVESRRVFLSLAL